MNRATFPRSAYRIFQAPLFAILPMLITSCSPQGQRHEVIQPPPLTSAETDKQFGLLKTGDPNQAAEALIALLPSGESLKLYYNGILETAVVASGEINTEILSQAASDGSRLPGHVGWERQRKIAILQWIAWTLWHMPTTPDKQVLIDTFIGDIGRLIDKRQLSPKAGLEIAHDAALLSEGILPDVSLGSLVTLFKKHADTAQGDDREYIYIALVGVLVLYEDPANTPGSNALYEYLKKHFPEKHLPPRFEQFASSGIFAGGAAPREEYNAVPELSLHQLEQALLSKHCNGVRCPHLMCDAILVEIFARYDTSQEEVTGVIAKLLGEGKYINKIAASILISLTYPNVGSKYASLESREPLINVFLASCDESLKDPKPDEFAEVTLALGSFLDNLAKYPDKAEPGSYMSNIQQRCGTMLLDSTTAWERLENSIPEAWNGASPTDILRDRWANLSPESRLHLIGLAEETLRTRKGYANLPSDRQEELDNEYNKLLSLKQSARDSNSAS